MHDGSERNALLIDGELRDVPCVIMRGGTSKAIFFDENDLPAQPEKRDRLILSVFGSPHHRQIDGLGGADPLTSKVAIVARSNEEGVDVRYTFGQVSIDEPNVDYSKNCGNISSAVGYYAIEEGLVAPREPTTEVTIKNTNNDILLTNEVPVDNGVPKVTGDFTISGVNTPGAKVIVGFRNPGGEVTGSVLPTGSPKNTITVEGEPVSYTVVDAAGNPTLFLRAADFGLDGTELSEELNSRDDVIGKMTELRAEIAVEAGIVDTLDDAKQCPQPVPVFISSPADYTDSEDNRVSETDLSLLVRRFIGTTPSDYQLHKAFSGTNTICTGVGSQIEGTVIDECISQEFAHKTGRSRLALGHPSGIMNAHVTRDDGVESVSFARTARRLMDGVAYY